MTLTITSVNVNGIRAAVKQRNDENPGMLGWLRDSGSDVVLLQEVRATIEETEAALAPVLAEGWHYVGAPAAAKGRAGVGILSRRPLENVRIGFGSFPDAGRWIEGSLDQVRLASLYLPSGSAGTEKLDEKYRFLDEFSQVLDDRAETYPEMVIGGDWNICHRREDLKNWKTNRKKSGFLPEERDFMDSVFGVFPDEQPQEKPGLGDYFGVVDYAGRDVRGTAAQPRWFDVGRRLQPEGEGPYTWWTFRGQAFNNNAGWRIDYQAATGAMLERAERSWVDRASSVETRWSDHAPLNVSYR
ncbi:exodeoxyribonuclease III [Corynebacterium alimapuense]|uniref:Exodeoxyribonuclease III n=1 Tax=Corynebacterium alimapuense TaxID=1576874 RepID=A0A3M8K6F7_9CORY|nr:exodeoxyribonuclease III [Corynebacterium alimapuense]RNE48803.1 exodeoxyribonuclease III [Corynebacterium alimapuense]